MTALTTNDLQHALGPKGLAGEISDLRRLTGGANKESWYFRLHTPAGTTAYILRRNTSSQAEMSDAGGFTQPEIHAEGQLIKALQNTGLKLPRVLAEFQADSSVGDAFLMTCEQGESLPGKILNLDKFTVARQNLATQCGQQLALLHSLDLSEQDLTQLEVDFSTAERVDDLAAASERLGNTSAVLELGLQWLKNNIPNSDRRCVVHGDFRLGNLLVTEDGLSSILDWELARLSHPEEDLGYISANTWRFGMPQNPVGGFGQYEELLDAYEQSAGWRPELAAIKFWQFFTTVGWGIICLTMRQMYLDGSDRSLERLAVGHRFSAAEVDILLLLDELA